MGYNDQRWGNDENRYGRGRDNRDSYGRSSYDQHDRGFFDRAGDEVRSWFGDEEAERRRRQDERYEDRYDRDDRSRAYGSGDYGRSAYGSQGSRDYGRSDYGRTDYGRGQERSYGGSVYGGAGFGGARGNDGPGGDRGYGNQAFGRDRDNADRYGSQWQGDTGRGQSQQRGGHHDQSYSSWRDRQLASFDQDYDEYRRDNQSKFENEFSTYRTRRQGQRDIVRQVQEHQEVIGSDGQHVGKVDHVQGDRIKLAKNDQAAGGHHHTIPSSWVDSLEDGKVKLSKTAEQAKHAWREEAEQQNRSGGDRGFFGRSDNADRSSETSNDRSFNRSFSGND